MPLLHVIYRDRLRDDVNGEAIWQANEDGAVGDIGYINDDGQFHQLFNAFDGDGISPPLLGKSLIRTQTQDHPPSWGASFSQDTSGEAGVSTGEMLSAQFRFSYSRRSEAFLSPKDSMVKTWFPASGRLAKYLITNQSDIRETYYEDHEFDTIMILKRTLHVGSWIQGVVHAREKSASGKLQLDPVQSIGATISVRHQSQNLHDPVVYGRTRDPTDSSQDCIVITAARIRFRRKVKEFLLKIRAKSGEKQMEGAAHQPPSSTSGSSQHSTASPVIYFRAADRINQAGYSGGTLSLPSRDADAEAASSEQDLAASGEAIMRDPEREKNRDAFDILLDGILEDYPDLDGAILEWNEELVFLLNDDTRILSTPELRRERFSVESLTSGGGIFGNVSLLPEGEDGVQLQQKQLETLREILLPMYSPGEYPDAPEPCADNTRVDVLSAIHEWAKLTSTPRVFWLAGPAGSGKSAISRSVTERLRSCGLIVLPFFFSRATRTRNTALALPAAIAYDLAAADLTARQMILQLVNDEPEILLSSLADQLQRLVFDPLVSALQADTDKAKHFVFLLDDVDGTVNEDITDLLAELLPALFGSQDRVKLFITGRDDTDMQATLTLLFMTENIRLDQLHIFSLLEVDDATVRSDMELFVQAKWELYSRTIAPALRTSGHPDPLGVADLTTPDHQLNERRLDEMVVAWETTHYRSAIAGSLYHALDRLYYIVVHKAITSDGPEGPMRRNLNDQTGSEPQDTTTEQLKMVIAFLALRTQPLSTEMVAEITTIPVDKLVVLFQGMSSVLRIPDAFRSSGGDVPGEAKRQAVEPYSQSFLDFIVDGVRSTEEDFHVRLDNYTSKFAAMTLNDVCRPQTKHISRAAEYSALCWHHYLLTGISRIDFDKTLVQLPLLRNSTHWRSGAVKGFSTMTRDHLKTLSSTCNSLLKSDTRDAFQEGLETLRKASETRHGRGRRIIGVAYAATIIALNFPRSDISGESFTDFISVFKSVEKDASSSPDAPPIPTEPEERLLKKAEELTDHQARFELKGGLRLLTKRVTTKLRLEKENEGRVDKSGLSGDKGLPRFCDGT
ncbi:hypothetical protein BKA62DRAFT_831872 [Auriculariales sp. MPI-PUGE-AT-0066]|nr:hypothetical protein BKA62DRAFT_831872 [Auriculariales sp. MPI-PUGE-AT-0066]